MAVVIERKLTLDDFEQLIKQGAFPDNDEVELVDGEIVILPPPSGYHNAVIMAIIEALLPYARSIGARLGSEGLGFAIGPNYRMADVSLTLKERLGIFTKERPYWALEPPDLAIEVLSPEQYGERYARQKVPEYLEAGAKVVWLVNPDTRTVRVFTADSDEVVTYSDDAEIDLDVIAPGFRSPVSAFFPEPL
jgi:Uma2 family endonuclease